MKYHERVAALEAKRKAAKTQQEKVEVLRLQQAVEWQRILEDPWFFIRYYCITEDEHDRDNPYKNIPDKLYLKLLILTRHKVDRLWVPKSRQMMVTWVLCMYDLWDAMTRSARLNVVQSKKEEDAEEVTLRAWGVYERLPDWIKERSPADYIDGQIKFWRVADKYRRKPKSRYEGIPQGGGAGSAGHQIRSRTPSSWFSDESAFQEEWLANYTAALSCLRGGGSGVCVSTAWPSTFFKYLRKAEKGTRKVLMESWHDQDGVVIWKSTYGWWVLQVHYSADPDKDAAWAEEAAKEYGGLDSPQWQQEMEINEHARSGARVCPAFHTKTHCLLEYDYEDLPLWVGIDPGYSPHPCAVSFITQNRSGIFIVVNELKEREKPVPEMARLVRRLLDDKFPERILIGHDARMTTQASPRSMVDQWMDEGFDVEPVYSKFEDTQAWLNELLRVRPNGFPRLMTLSHCIEHQKEFELWRYPELTEKQRSLGTAPNKPIEANDDCMHAMRNVLMNVDEKFYQKFKRRDPLGEHLAAMRSAPQKMRDAVMHGGSTRQMGVPGQDLFWDTGSEVW